MVDIHFLCPYCGYNLEIMPKRKKKCPSCAQPIYVKYTPDNRIKRMMTEQQALEAEKQWELHSIREYFINALSLFKYGEREIEKERILGATNDNEAVFRILNRLTISENDLYKLKMAYLIMTGLAIETGKPYQSFQLAAHQCELLMYKERNIVKNVEIHNNNNNICIECQNNKGKIYDINKALKLNPLPCPKCTCTGTNGQKGFCECYYLPILPKYD